jgi:hypothetical protein
MNGDETVSNNHGMKLSILSCNDLYCIHPSLNMQKQQFTGIN